MAKILLDWTQNSAPLDVVRALREAGHEAFLAGGCVRDLLLGLSPKDHDIATSATPDQVKAAFRRTVPVQPELGVTMVLLGDERLEVTTYRSEGAYLDGRRPSNVGPADAKLDVQRRDFTINGLLLDPETGEVHDHVGGVQDLRDGILRCIRDARERFEEDHLRILRAVRFAVRFGFSIEPATWEAMQDLSDRVATLSGERIHEELDKMEAQGSFGKAFELLLDSGAIRALDVRLHDRLRDPVSRERLARLLAGPRRVPGSWVALLAMPLCDWWATPLDFGKPTPIHPAQKSWLERLRCSRLESEAAMFVWSRWPLCWESPVPPPSHRAPLVRDRSWPAMADALERFRTVFPGQASPLEHLEPLARTIPKSLPALGLEFQAAGVPKGPRLGDAIREADRLHLDEGLPLDADLVSRVAKTILAP